MNNKRDTLNYWDKDIDKAKNIICKWCVYHSHKGYCEYYNAYYDDNHKACEQWEELE